tara:strand:+ start:10758 stop:11042 length:285 start_codon:yes stop_codon:yes gene_type:complete
MPPTKMPLFVRGQPGYIRAWVCGVEGMHEAGCTSEKVKSASNASSKAQRRPFFSRRSLWRQAHSQWDAASGMWERLGGASMALPNNTLRLQAHD